MSTPSESKLSSRIFMYFQSSTPKNWNEILGVPPLGGESTWQVVRKLNATKENEPSPAWKLRICRKRYLKYHQILSNKLFGGLPSGNLS